MEYSKEIYMQSAAYARSNGEIEPYHLSRRANIDCARAIERAIKENFDGMHLNEYVHKGVIEKFGVDRVEHVLGATVRYKNWDGRFSRNNKSWAKSLPSVKDPDVTGVDRSWEYVVESHPAVLDGFINLARKEIEEIRNAKERPSALERLRTEQPAKKTETKDAKHREEAR